MLSNAHPKPLPRVLEKLQHRAEEKRALRAVWAEVDKRDGGLRLESGVSFDVELGGAMDLRTGRTYESKGDALAAGVPESDIVEVMPSQETTKPPTVRFSKNVFGSFRNVPTAQETK